MYHPNSQQRFAGRGRLMVHRRRSRIIKGIIGSAFVGICALANSARCDIFQWQYVYPPNPNLGVQRSSILCPDGAGVSAAPRANLASLNLTMAYLDLSNLTSANLSQANL